METLEQNRVGLDQHTSVHIAEKLNQLLGNYQIFYMNVRGFHWNIRGPLFYVFHEKFEELYKDSADRIDTIAERILTLGFKPELARCSYTDMLDLEERENIVDVQKAIQSTLHGLRILLAIEREILDLSAESGDEGTNGIMSDLIGEHEQLVWMYSASLG